MFKINNISRIVVGFAVIGILAATSGCGALGDKFEQAFKGIPATLSSYDFKGQEADRVHATSFQIERDDEFDTANSDGTTNNDSSVLLISVGKQHMHLVGSSVLLVQDGLTDVTAGLPKEARFNNVDPGTPWLNNIHYRFGNLWKGSSQTIMIRSQDGTPIKVFAGNDVQILATDVPKSTWFRIDGKTLFAYRVNYTVVDTALIQDAP